ncbi:DMT family transporter [Devosia sp.]|uniref:DMT family transporter n=1 Tax=Devosia sp. TaxID=1871048 RepID=UPI003BAC0958
MKLTTLTTIAMLAFAANSVLARLAFVSASADPLTYTGVRLASGALVLLALVIARQDRGSRFQLAGSWAGAAALTGYALAFSVAYILLGAGTGALILFASVQFGILGWAVIKGDRPGLLEWIGLAIAFAGLAYLVSPGLVAPHPLGALLMLISGLCWAAYTLLGRGSRTPLRDTAGNFTRSMPLALLLIVGGLLTHALSPAALAYAAASGAIASGLGYAIWYAALPGLTRTRSAIVQLTVPAIAATGGVLFIAEPLSPRLLIASAAILGGVAIALSVASRRQARKAV